MTSSKPDPNSPYSYSGSSWQQAPTQPAAPPPAYPSLGYPPPPTSIAATTNPTPAPFNWYPSDSTLQEYPALAYSAASGYKDPYAPTSSTPGLGNGISSAPGTPAQPISLETPPPKTGKNWKKGLLAVIVLVVLVVLFCLLCHWLLGWGCVLSKKAKR